MPGWRPALLGGLIWAIVAIACAFTGLKLGGWQTVEKLESVALLYGFSAFIAFPVAVWIARLLSLDRSADVAFAAFFVTLAMATISLTAAVFGLQYRFYYAEWHATPFSKIWLIQFIHTVGGAVFQFAVLGVRLYFPLGFAALFVAGLWFRRTAR